MSSDKPSAPLSFSVIINRHIAEIQSILRALHYSASHDFPIDSEIEGRLQNLAASLERLQTLEKEGWELTEKPNGNSFLVHRLSTKLIKHDIVRDAVRLQELRCCAWHSVEYYPTEDVFELKLPSGIYLYLKAKHLPLPALPFDKLKLVKLKDGFTWLSEETLKQLYQYLNR